MSQQISLKNICDLLGYLSSQLEGCSPLESLAAGMMISINLNDRNKPIDLIRLARNISSGIPKLSSPAIMKPAPLNVIAPLLHSYVNEEYIGTQIYNKFTEFERDGNLN